ncbi:hypothetical protein ASPZODRAFT_60514 [Penicilliopsis zonata CBS 506.65]|uniref:Microbial-type PARG catalytic domain-containing protein n=1 Tax=Penicilliopsis zonata CBS 506.65 TaxID=1073090 RepID=A0A1L9SQJ2_9EURO|nr:hypothetical protein ASPZODRAFT_60514 [Penicilliopsis zonata CBS 506.65]OJJ49396.1 hypothetical protein ASPZODRAFT_60514 [Penicilliopsis zonata CBS 506.65]
MKVQVINKDTVDAALDILKNCNTKRVCILNFANETNPGSAWRSGVIAQEEDICRRTSLHLTLNKKFYPLRYEDAIYSTEVLVIRENFASQHKLFDVTRPETLPSISVISMAAIYAPKTDSGRTKYLDPVERDQMKSQIRLTLSIAAVNSHRYLVVGAFGCGHYKHPLQDSAQCWKEVLQEPEFSCRWEGIYFAITGGRNKNGISIYQEALDGLTV